MKKLMGVLLAAVVLVASVVPAFAAGINADEKAILDNLKSGVTVAGTTLNIPADYITQAENYLNTVDVTAEQAKEINRYINAAKEAVIAGGTADLSKLSSTVKSSVVDFASKAAAVLNLKLTYNSSTKVVKIVDAQGKVVFDKTVPVKTTGMDVNTTGMLVVATAVVGVIAAGFVCTKKLKLAQEA